MNRRPAYVSGLFVALAALLAGCPSSSTTDFSEIDIRGENSLRGSQDHLERAVRLIDHLEGYDHSQASSQVMAHLGQWIEGQPPIDDWSGDAMHAQLPARYRRVAGEQTLPLMQFLLPDFYMLREASWLRDISNWQVRMQRSRRSRGLAEGEADPAWLTELQNAAGETALDDLLRTRQLFDWTVRNLQLKPTNWNITSGDDASSEAGRPLTPPPGAEYYVWQALMMGRADAVTRARTFVLLLRQQRIPAVVLGVAGEGEADEPREWAVAVLIAERLYLFDLELGLPIAGPGGAEVATWRQVQDDPALLRRLDVSADQPYWVQAEDLQRVEALIDGTPQSLSQRMLLVQRKLTGDMQLVLTTEPSRLRKRLRELGVAKSRLWTAPYRAYLFNNQRERHPPTQAVFQRDFAVFGAAMPMFPARISHLRGYLENTEDAHGAKALYLDCRRSNRELDSVAESEELRKQLGRSPAFRDNPAAQAKFIEGMRRTAQEVKIHASYWLGLIAYETSDYGVAVDYLQNRTLAAYPDGVWTNGAHYNLGRIWEATGQVQQAVEAYQAADGPPATRQPPPSQAPRRRRLLTPLRPPSRQTAPHPAA